MTSFNPIAYPSMFQLARGGNFRAIACLINSYLAPYGIYVRAQPVHAGCLPLKVEFESLPDQPEMIGVMRDRIIQFICHHLWRLNSEVIEGVRIVGLWSGNGQPNVLWHQSVRIVTPANRRRQKHLIALQAQARKLLNFKINRLFLFTGFSIVSFLIGFSLVASQLQQKSASNPDRQNPKSPVSVDRADEIKNQRRNNQVKAALEEVKVVQHTDVKNPSDPTVTMMFAGDVTLGYAFEDLIGQDYQWAFDAMPEYRDVDVAMVNLEGTLTTAETEYEKTFNFQAHPEQVEVLTHGGVDIVNLANNHAMDYMEAGLQETLTTLEQAGIHSVGAGMNLTEARRPEILEVKGQRIAYFGYYTGEDHQATDTTAGTNPALEARIAEDIQAIRDQVDWIIVNFHWGVELSNYPETWQSKLAHFAIDQGADVVVGHHPHVLQGSEIYRGRPIAYSLGNFIFGGNARSDYDTAVLKVSVREKQMKVEFLPVEVRKYQPKIVQGERGDRIMAEIAMFSNIFDQAMTSPMILDAKSSEVIADPENSVFASNPSGSPENIPGAAGNNPINNSTIGKTPDGETITFPLNTTDETGTFEQSAFTSAEDGLEIAIPSEPEPGTTQATSDPALTSPEPESSNYLTFATGTAVAIAVAAGAAIATNKKKGGRKPIQLPLLPNLRG